MKLRICIFFAFLVSINISDAAQWEKVLYNLDGITLNDVCIISETKAVAVGEYGVVRSTTDGGNSWTAIALPQKVNLYGIAKMDAVNLIAVGDAGAVLISKDQGKTWSEMVAAEEQTNENLRDIAFFDKENGIIAGDKGTILKTADGGASWILAGNKNDENLKSIAYANSSTIVCVGDAGTILISTNSGSDWTAKASNTKANLKFVRAPHENHIYAVGDSLTVTISNDIGETWNLGKLNTTNTKFRRPEIKGCVFFDSLFGIVRVDDIYSSSPIMSEISTIDGGKSWYFRDMSGFSGMKRAYEPKSIEFLNDEFGICVGADGEISTLGLTNNLLNYLIRTFSYSFTFEKIATKGHSNIVAVYNYGDLFDAILSEDAGKTWKLLPDIDTIGYYRGLPDFQALAYPEENILYFAMNNTKDTSYKSGSSTIYLTYYYGFILKSADKGNSWKEIVFPSKAKINNIVMLDTEDGIAQIGKKYFYKTNDGWITYDSVFVPDTSIHSISQVLYPEKNHYFVIALDSSYQKKFYFTTDGGNSWDSTLKTPRDIINLKYLDKDRIYTWQIFYDSLENKYYDRIYSTNDWGANWSVQLNEPTQKSHNITRMFFNYNTGIAFKKSNYPIAQELEYYYTTDKGNSWAMKGMPGMDSYETIVDLAFLNNETMFAVGNSGSMMKYDYNITDVFEENCITESNGIYITPNPAGDYISVIVETHGRASLLSDNIRIYNSIGECVVVVWTNVETHGRASLRIDTSELPPGIYFLRLGGQSTKFVKM